MNDAIGQLDDLTVSSGHLERSSSFTLTGIVHNEMHFLPAFLPHYRNLGVDRFIFIDDQSNDGTAAYLADQPDVVVLRSQWRYGHRLTVDDSVHPSLYQMRIANVWRNLLLRRFGIDRWSLHLDADEFLDLPVGMQIQDVAAVAEGSGAQSIWSVMIDMYPATAHELIEMRNDPVIDFDRAWFFDGCPHLRLRKDKAPRRIYAGSRARLMARHDLNPKANWFDRKIGKPLGLSPPGYNSIRKPILVRWKAGARLISAHSVNVPASSQYLLPLRITNLTVLSRRGSAGH